MADYSVLLKDYLNARFGINISKIERSWFRLPSGATIYVNGSKLLVIQGDSYGWYDLEFKEYEKIVTNSNYYYVIILDKPELAFILTSSKLKEIFSEVSKGDDNKWYYKVRKKDGHYILRPSNDHRNTSNIHYVEDFLNRWTQIEDFKEIQELTDITSKKGPAGANDNPRPINNLLSFIDLQKFLLKEMRTQANYQPIMIKTLLLSEGRASKEYIATKIKELNPEKVDQDFKNIPVYEVLEGRGVVRRLDDDFILNSVELTKQHNQQLVALCNWKIDNMPLQLEELIQAFNTNKSLFDPNHITLQEREKLRSSFVSAFPVDAILDMKLDDYVEGKRDPNTKEVNRTTFCYRLEQELDILSGIGGIPNKKFGIYFNWKMQDYDYNKKKYESPETAFQAIRSEIYTILEAGKHFKEDKNWDNLSEILERDSNIYKIVKSKILSVYYPEDFIQIHSLKYLKIILEAFGKPTIDVQDKLFLMQARLLDVKNRHLIMKEWHNEDFTHFVWRAIVKRNESVSESKEEDSKKSQKKERTIFVTAYDDSNLNRSKELGVLGWKSNSRLLSSGDYVFVFNKSTLNIEVCFGIKSRSDNIDTIWSDELESNRVIYNNRWNAEKIADNLEIPLKVINKMPPFNKESFQLRLKGNFPMPLNSPAINNKYRDFCNFLLSKIGNTLLTEYGKSVEQGKPQWKNWLSLTKEDIDEIVLDVLHWTDGKKLAIDEKIVRRIIVHLISAKHVILVGPPGTGKTDLARRLLHELGIRILGLSDFIVAVASYEWGRYDVIGGNSLVTDNTTSKFLFHYGCVTKAIKDNKLLLIDEFNRADMNKAFGEMFLAIDHDVIQLKEDEIPDGLSSPIVIPPHFRMICTMNDYDKSLLNDLSYGLLRRFAFVEIGTPNDKKELKSVVEQRVINNLSTPNYSYGAKLQGIIADIDEHIDKLIDFVYAVRSGRELGVSTIIDVVRYIVTGNLIEKEDNYWKLLNEALIDYVLPQLDRLDVTTLRLVESAVKNNFRDKNDNPIIETDRLCQKLSDMISKLQSMTDLFKT